MQGGGDYTPSYENFSNMNMGQTSHPSTLPSGFSTGSQVEKREPISGGFPEREVKPTSNGYILEEVEPESPTTDRETFEDADYGRNGYLNHMNINYDGGDDGESYFTGPDSDITFMDIIEPTVLEGHL